MCLSAHTIVRELGTTTPDAGWFMSGRRSPNLDYVAHTWIYQRMAPAVLGIYFLCFLLPFWHLTNHGNNMMTPTIAGSSRTPRLGGVRAPKWHPEKYCVALLDNRVRVLALTRAANKASSLPAWPSGPRA